MSDWTSEENGVTNDIPPIDTMVPEKVLGAVLIDGNINYIVKWNNIDMAATLESEFVRKEWPKLVIKYFESITVNSNTS